MSEENGDGHANRSRESSQGSGLLSYLHSYGGSGGGTQGEETFGGAGTEMLAVFLGAGCRTSSTVSQRSINKIFAGVVRGAGFWDTRSSGGDET